MAPVTLGLRENRTQFALLVLMNAFVGGMVGLERSILPTLAEQVFAIAAKTALLSFIVAFGLAKAFANYAAGALANYFGRRRLLILGWLLGTPVPFILMWAPSWEWVVATNILLGIHQGFAWSSTVVMKMDLVDEKQRGLAMGLNEFSGYLAVALVAFLTGWLATEHGLRPVPFYTGIILVFAGLFGTIFWVKDTRRHVEAAIATSEMPRLRHLFWQTTWKHRNLGSVSQAGLINNLNDGMIWGILPLLLMAKGFTLAQIGLAAGIYPAVWGLGQLITGPLSDRFCKKYLLQWGMLLQAVAIALLLLATNLWHYLLLMTALGWGTAMVYPTFLASIADNTHPIDRAKSVGIFRFWRDMGYAIGALLIGFLADRWGMDAAIIIVAVITALSAVVIAVRMRC